MGNAELMALLHLQYGAWAPIVAKGGGKADGALLIWATTILPACLSLPATC